jgi:hypothetical protein
MLKSDAIPLFVPAGTSIQLSRKKSNNFGRFQAVGELSTLEKKASYDLLEAVTTLSKGAQRLFIHIIKHRDDCNFCHVPRESEVGTAAYKVTMRWFAEIKKLDLITNIKRDHIPLLGLQRKQYEKHHLVMLNPSYIKCREQTNSQIYWNSIKRAK